MLGTQRRTFGNIVGHVKGVERHVVAGQTGPTEQFDPTLDWEDLEWIKNNGAAR
jgi:L-lactate dehydrogenase (cytochrome)